MILSRLAKDTVVEIFVRAMLFKGKELSRNHQEKEIDQLKQLVLHKTHKRYKC